MSPLLSEELPPRMPEEAVHLCAVMFVDHEGGNREMNYYYHYS